MYQQSVLRPTCTATHSDLVLRLWELWFARSRESIQRDPLVNPYQTRPLLVPMIHCLRVAQDAFVGTASRASGSARITLPIRHTGGSALHSPGDPATQFQVYHSGDISVALPVSSVDLSSSTGLVLTLASVRPDTQALDVWYRLPFDSATASGSVIYDNDLSGGDGLGIGRPLKMLAAPLVVPAPSQVLRQPVLIRAGVTMLTKPDSIVFAS